MTPDLLDEGAKRVSAFSQKHQAGRTESGGLARSISCGCRCANPLRS